MSESKIAVPPKKPRPKLSRSYPMVGRAREAGERRVWSGFGVNSFVWGSAGDESISDSTDPGAGADEWGVPGAAGALDARKPVGGRYPAPPARGSGTWAVPPGAVDATAVEGVAGRRCAASSEATGGFAGGWYG